MVDLAKGNASVKSRRIKFHAVILFTVYIPPVTFIIPKMFSSYSVAGKLPRELEESIISTNSISTYEIFNLYHYRGTYASAREDIRPFPLSTGKDFK